MRTTKAEELALWRRMRRGDESAREELVVRNLQLAYWFAWRYRSILGASLEDLQSEAASAMLADAHRFDARRARFGTFILPWIKRAVFAALKKNRLVGVPVRQRAALGSERLVPFHRLPDQGRGAWVPEERLGTPAEQGAAVLRRELQELLKKVLTKRDARVLRERYGLDGGPGATLKGVGGRIGLSRERVRQIEAAALATLRAEISRRGSKIRLREAS